MMNVVNNMWPSVHRHITLPSPCSCLLMPCAPKSCPSPLLLPDSCSDIRKIRELIGLEGLKYVLRCPSLLLSAAVISNSHLQVSPPRPEILQENVGFILPTGDAGFTNFCDLCYKMSAF